MHSSYRVQHFFLVVGAFFFLLNLASAVFGLVTVLFFPFFVGLFPFAFCFLPTICVGFAGLPVLYACISESGIAWPIRKFEPRHVPPVRAMSSDCAYIQYAGPE